MLKCIEVSKTFGGLQALKKVDLIVNENEIVGLVGPNGSGKSTLLNLISGVYKPDAAKSSSKAKKSQKYHPTRYAQKA